MNDGLSQNSIWSLCRDDEGYLWVGTADGLNRYNGVDIKVYKHHEKDEKSISGNNILFIFQDKLKQMWIGSEGGIDIYNPVTDDFIHVYQYPSNKYFLNRSEFILQEPDSNHIWILLSDFGIQRFSIKTPKFSSPIDLPGTFRDVGPYVIYKCGYNQKEAFLAINNSNLLRYDFQNKTWKHYSVKGKRSNRFFLIDANIYYCENGALYKFNTQNGESERLCSISNMNNCLNIIKLDQQIFLISESGYAIYNPHKKVANLFNSFTTNRFESYYRLSSVLYDKEGMLWIGTDGKGIYYTSKFTNKFKTFQSSSDDENMIKGITTLNDDEMAVVAYNKGVLLWDMNLFASTTIAGNQAFPNSTSLKYTSICKENENEVWVSNTSDEGNGLFLLNVRTKKGRNFTSLLSNHHAKRMPGTYYTYLLKNKNKMYVANFNQIIEVEKKGNAFISKVFYENNKSGISCFYFSEDGKFCFIGKTDGTEVLTIKDKSIYNLSKNGYQITKSITEDRNKNYYVATTNGVYVYDSILNPVSYLNTENGLPDNFTYGILCDASGKIWISHNKGLSKFSPSISAFKNFDVTDGLQSNEFNTGAFYKSENGMLFFAGINGTNAFTPIEIKDNPNKPKIQITSIKLFDEPLAMDSSYSLIQSLTLPYYQNTLSFDFVALEFADIDKNTYSYLLEGYDQKWINSGNKHFARYANLPPGNYVFKIRAANADGVWSSEPKLLSIVITPPFWKTAWFDVLIVLALLAAAYGLVYLLNARQQNKLKRERDLQLKLNAERLRISRDLHDHVGAQLSYLITNIDWMRTHPNELSLEEEQNRLSSLEEAGRQAIITLRQTIWAISQHELSVEELADRFKQYAIKMLDFNKEIQVHFKDEIVMNELLSPTLALNIFRVCQEAFNNAVRHSNAKNIYISFKDSEIKKFIFEVKDDGIGFDPDNTNKEGHYGLQNMKARAEESMVKLEITSSLGNGTKVVISL